METVGAITAEGEWTPFNGMCSEEADFMVQLLGNSSLPADVPSSSSFAFSTTFWPDHELYQSVAGVDESGMYTSGETNTNMYSFLRGSSCNGGDNIFFPSSNHESYFPCVPSQNLSTNQNSITMDYCMMSGVNSSCRVPFHTSEVMEGNNFLNHDASNDSMESDKKPTENVLQGKDFQFRKGQRIPISKPLNEDETSPLAASKKRSLISGELQKAKRIMRSKKGANIDDNGGDDNTNLVLNRQSSSSCLSEDDSNASHSSSKGSGARNLNGKTRAVRGAATDPQSLYARKRRERINERLRILQNLVPNGTKVDISTMLEEAVQYVKFLQLQIKLLSSDDLWMYAPIAYNGMDIGRLHLNLPTLKLQSQ